MKSILLLPNSLRKIGWLLLPLSVAFLVAVMVYDYSVPFLQLEHKTSTNALDISKYDMSDELAILMTFVSLFMIAFTKEKEEDEYVASVRLKALQVSVYVNYLVLVVGLFAIYGLSFLWVLYGNLFTILVIFIVVYYYQLHLKARLKPQHV